MKTLTISVADDVYQRASQKAAERDTSLRDVVQEFLAQWTGPGDRDVSIETSPDAVTGTRQPNANNAAAAERGDELRQFFAELNSLPREPGPSLGPLNREEIYQRGIRRH